MSASLTNHLQVSVINYISRYKFTKGKDDLLRAKFVIDLILELEYNVEPQKYTFPVEEV